MRATGTFKAEIKPLDSYSDGTQGNQLGRMSIDKTFTGDLEATSKGEMLSAMTPTKGSAGYVAIEQVTGTLKGKAGSFVLQHFGIMDNGNDRLVLEVVPDSGTGELIWISGSMSITIEDGKHFYDFEFRIA